MMDYRKTLHANKIATLIIGDQIVLDFGTLFPTEAIPDHAELRLPWAVAFDQADLKLIDEAIVYIDRRTAAQLYLNLKSLADNGMFDEFGSCDVAV